MMLFKISMLGALLWGAVAFVTSCGGSSASNGTDSNTHWLKDCDKDSDCGSLSCVCGVCSTPCESDAACSAFGSEATCEVPAGCGASTTACVRASGGGGEGGGGGGPPNTACDAMDAHTGSLSCATVVGYAYDGRICGPVACSCEGSECDQLFASMAECDAAYTDCYSMQGVLQSCSGHASCHVLPRTCCPSCGVPEPDTLIATYSRQLSLNDQCIGDPDAGCPECGTTSNPDVSARCVEETCQLVDLTGQTDCQTTEDCQLVSKDCCTCAEDPRSGFVAMSKNAGRPSFCGNDDCEPCMRESDLQVGVTCNTELGKCEMVSIPDFGCTPVDCKSLDEASCKQHAATAASDGCVPRYGAPWPGDPSVLQYAGCAQICCDGNGECPGSIDAEVCVADEAGVCWTLSAPPVPQGWKLLLEDGCGEVPQCND